jgi:3-methyladenine DNA glycosylase AlkC
LAEPLKHLLGSDTVSWIADGLAAAHESFDRSSFIRDCLDGLDELELKPRANHIADIMSKHLPQHFPDAAGIIAASLGPEADPSGNTGTNVLRYMPHDSFIHTYGIDHFEAATKLQEDLTKRFTCEFSIRGFIEKYPDQSMAQLRLWAKDESVHVRRLVSEGTRPRLPWAPRLRDFQRDPAPVIALLELLKDDPERYVQRSVANNLNDIAKDHPALVTELCARWLEGAGPGRKWIVGHALRSLIKQGHSGALGLLGAGAAPNVKISSFALSPQMPRMGDQLLVSFTLTSASDQAQDLLIDYAVHYVKSNGRTSRKVFKLKRLLLGPNETMVLSRTLSLADMTTRKHYPGTHAVEAIVNGVTFPLGAFELS